MTRLPTLASTSLAVLALVATVAWSQDAAPADPASDSVSGASDDPNIAVAYEQDGRYFTAKDVPT